MCLFISEEKNVRLRKIISHRGVAVCRTVVAGRDVVRAVIRNCKNKRNIYVGLVLLMKRWSLCNVKIVILQRHISGFCLMDLAWSGGVTGNIKIGGPQ